MALWLAFARNWIDAVSRHKQVATEACQTAETTVTAVKGLDETIRHGWREVNTEKLAERIHAELEGTLLQPLAIQCRHLEKAAPDLQDAVQRMEDSTRKLRAFHFKGILAVMLAACLVVMGGCFSLGWWKLSRHYDRMVDAALKRIRLGQCGQSGSFHPADRDERPYPRASRHRRKASRRFPENSPWLWTMLKTWPSRTLPTGRERQFISRNPPIENGTCRDNQRVGPTVVIGRGFRPRTWEDEMAGR